MKIGVFVVLIVLAFASEQNKNEAENIAKSETRIEETSAESFEEENGKTSKYVGVNFYKSHSNWRAIRWSKNDYTMTYSGPYKEEETAAHASDKLARKLMENGEHGHKLNFPDDQTDVYPEEMKTSKYFGVSYIKRDEKWCVQRYNKNEKKLVYNGYYKDEKTAAYASDTLARKLMENSNQNLKLNFPNDHAEVWAEVYSEKMKSSKYIGVSYNKERSKWYAQRYSKNEIKVAYNGNFNDEKTAAHASDTLARKLMTNGEKNHKLNFPDDYTEVYPEKMKTSSNYIGVSYNKRVGKWCVQRYNKNEKKLVYYGNYKNKETAAHASDTLARKLMANSNENLELNFPKDHTEVYPEETKTSSNYIGVSYNKKDEKWHVQRRSKNEKKVIPNGTYEYEKTAAHASDILARKLMEDGEHGHKLNFPDDYQKIKRKRSNHEHLGYSQNK